jgi:hypothetical protein
LTVLVEIARISVLGVLAELTVRVHLDIIEGEIAACGAGRRRQPAAGLNWERSIHGTNLHDLDH